MKYIVYSDGACAVSKCLGGYAAIVRNDLGRVMIHGAKRNATNNEMELLAVVSALRHVTPSIKKRDSIEVYTDSAYIVNTINNGWYKYWASHNWTTRGEGNPICNKRLWMELIRYVEEFPVSFIWVKGHAGDPYNEKCDRLATDEVKFLKQEEITENVGRS